MLGGVAGWNIAIGLWFFCGFRVAGFGTLLGPEGTPGDRLCFLAAPGLDRLTHPYCGCGGDRIGVGVWLCVECCIVDASILL